LTARKVEKIPDNELRADWKMIDTAFIFQVPAHYPVVTFVFLFLLDLEVEEEGRGSMRF